MKNIIFLTVLSTLSLTSVFSQNVEKKTTQLTYVTPDSITIANGTKIPYSEFKKRCDDAWNASFGQMSESDKKLFEGVNVGVSLPKKEEVVEPEKPNRPISK